MPAKAEASGNAEYVFSVEDLRRFLEEHRDQLVDTSIEIAKRNGYAPYTTTIRAAWVEAINGVTQSLTVYLAGHLSADRDEPQGPSADIDYRSDPRFADMRRIARLHRSLGITLQLYLGLFAHFRNLYVEILESASPDLPLTGAHLGRVRDFFDEAGLSIASDWNEPNSDRRIRELQERARAVTLDKDRYFAVFESLRNPAFLLGRNRRLVNANQAAVELFLGAAEAGELIYLKSKRRQKQSLQDLVRTITISVDHSDNGLWLDTRSGRRCFDVRTRDLHDTLENTSLGQVILLNDVTSHRRATEQAQQAEQTMSRFLATMSHEIRTPLHSVLGATDLLRSARPGATRPYIDTIESAGKTLLQTLNNVLDYSKLENAAPVPRPQDIHIRSAMRDFRRAASVWARQRSVPFAVDIAEGLADTISLDWSMCQQVLSNLVSNAIRHDDGQGVDLLVESRQNDGTSKLRFAVSDHGPGLTSDDARALSVPYTKLRARNTPGGGAGLGLAIAHHLVEAMGGTMGFALRHPGTVIWFEIPYRVSQTDRNDMLSDGTVFRARQCTQLKCLLIDDDIIGRSVTAEFLTRCGVSVECAASVATAEKMTEAGRYDVVLADYALPDGTGADFVRRFRARGQEARCYALTANVETLLNKTGERDLFDDVLAKPVGRESLTSIVLHGERHASDDDAPPIYTMSKQARLAMQSAFAEQWQDLIAARVLPVNEQSAPALGEKAHRLIGAAAALGLQDIERELRQLERTCRTGGTADAASRQFGVLREDLTSYASWRAFQGLTPDRPR